MSTEFRLYTPGGASIDLDKLIDILEGRAEKAEAAQEAQRRIMNSAHFRNTDEMAKAVADIACQMGEQIGFIGAVNLLKSVKEELIKKDSR